MQLILLQLRLKIANKQHNQKIESYLISLIPSKLINNLSKPEATPEHSGILSKHPNNSPSISKIGLPCSLRIAKFFQIVLVAQPFL